MRVSLGSVSAIVLAVALCGACSEKGAGQAQASAAAQVQKITAVGCPVAAPTTGCLTITADGQNYDLAGATPAIDMSRKVGVSVTGRPVGGTSACGVKLTDIQVDYLGISC